MDWKETMTLTAAVLAKHTTTSAAIATVPVLWTHWLQPSAAVAASVASFAWMCIRIAIDTGEYLDKRRLARGPRGRSGVQGDPGTPGLKGDPGTPGLKGDPGTHTILNVTQEKPNV
jgi:hypothetical protein